MNLEKPYSRSVVHGDMMDLQLIVQVINTLLNVMKDWSSWKCQAKIVHKDKKILGNMHSHVSFQYLLTSF